MKNLDTVLGCLIIPLASLGAWYLSWWVNAEMRSWSPWIGYPVLFIALYFAVYSPANLVRFARSVTASHKINSIPFARKYGFTKFGTPLSTNLFLFLILIVIPWLFLAWAFSFL